MIDLALFRQRYSPHKGDTGAWLLADVLVLLIILLLFVLAMTPPGGTSGIREREAYSHLSTFEKSESRTSGPSTSESRASGEADP